MSIREDEWYEIAAREVCEKNMAPAAWGRAFSEALGNDQLSLALYIKHRVQQLEREYKEEQLLGYCVPCGRKIKPLLQSRDFLAFVFSGKPNTYYGCPHCKAEVEKTTKKIQ